MTTTIEDETTGTAETDAAYILRLRQANREASLEIARLHEKLDRYGWKRFDREKPETWPKEEDHYLVACTECVPVTAWWDGMMEFWPVLDPFSKVTGPAYAYMPVPMPPSEWDTTNDPAPTASPTP